MDPTLAYSTGANILNEIFKPMPSGVAKSPGRGRVRPRSRSRGPASVDVGPKITFPLRPSGSSKNVLKPKSGITVQELERQHAPGPKTLPKEPVKRPDKENVKVATKPTVVPDKDKSEDLPRKTYNLRRRSALPAPEVVEEKIALPPVPVVHNVTDGQFSNAEEDITVHQGEPWTVVDQMSDVDKLDLTKICHDLTVMQVLGDKENCYKKPSPANDQVNEPPIVKKVYNKVIARPQATPQFNSPVAGGNLGGKAKRITEKIPQGGLSSPCSSSTKSSEELLSKLGMSSIIKPSATSVQNLGTYENLVSSGSARTSKRPVSLKEKDIFKSSDVGFMPITLAKGREYLFATSQKTNQVQVFRDNAQQGVLKMNESKYFTVLHCVHFIEMPKASDDRLVVLDNEGFHFFNEHGLYLHTKMEKEGYMYRGMGHVVYEQRLCLITLDISQLGVSVLLMDLDKDSDTYGTFIKRIKIKETGELKDEATKCRFITAANHNQILVTAMKLNHIYLIELDSEFTRILGPFSKPEDKDKPENSFSIDQPSGIVVDRKSGYIFISSRGNKRIEILNKNFVYEASYENDSKFDPVGLVLKDGILHVANNGYRNILTLRFKH